MVQQPLQYISGCATSNQLALWVYVRKEILRSGLTTIDAAKHFTPMQTMRLAHAKVGFDLILQWKEPQHTARRPQSLVVSLRWRG